MASLFDWEEQDRYLNGEGKGYSKPPKPSQAKAEKAVREYERARAKLQAKARSEGHFILWEKEQIEWWDGGCKP